VEQFLLGAREQIMQKLDFELAEQLLRAFAPV
jgi:hypothetical protein